MSIRIYNSIDSIDLIDSIDSIDLIDLIDSIDLMKYEKNYVQPNFNSAERVYILIDSQ